MGVLTLNRNQLIIDYSFEYYANPANFIRLRFELIVDCNYLDVMKRHFRARQQATFGLNPNIKINSNSSQLIK